MPPLQDGPASPLFIPLFIEGNTTRAALPAAGISPEMAAALPQAPAGACVSWGIPFWVDGLVLLKDQPVTLPLGRVIARWFVFLHTSDLRPLALDQAGFIPHTTGRGHLNEHAADYVVIYEDGSEERLPIHRRLQVGAFQRAWGENCLQAVGHHKPNPIRGGQEQMNPSWGRSQTRVTAADGGLWVNWLCAWDNPHPEKAVVGVRLEPVSGVVLLSGISVGDVGSTPLRWQPRRKAILRLPEGLAFRPELDENGLLKQLRLDMGQIISATPRTLYPQSAWADTYNNQVPEISPREVLIEYTAHDEARFHLEDSLVFPLSDLAQAAEDAPLRPVAPATQRVTLRVVDKGGHKPIPVKLHVHGEAGEYLAPVDRHRIPNPAWYEDWSVDFSHQASTTAPTSRARRTIDLPLGRVYVEVSKGFEIAPVRRVFVVTPATRELTIDLGEGAALAGARLGHRRHARALPLAPVRRCWRAPPKGSTSSTCWPASGAS